MASTWAGFTEQDLREIKEPSTNTKGPRSEYKNVQIVPKKKQQTSKPRVRSHANQQTKSSENSRSALLPAQTLSQLTKPQSTNKSISPQQKDTEVSKTNNGISENQGDSDLQKSQNENQANMELDEKEVIVREKSSLDKFREQQKQIEEANKQKKALLSKAIEERKKKAKAETTKLIQIQNEMKHIDTLLTCDVSIIRDRIEQSSRDFLEAQKRYEKAESEFIEAKMDLFNKSEQKEQLTEHLYTIIHQNELRKAKKLAELMQQLEMEISEEDVEASVVTLPPLSMFRATPFQTLHSPPSPVKSNVNDEVPKNSIPTDSAGSEPSGISGDKGRNCVTDNSVKTEPVDSENKESKETLTHSDKVTANTNDKSAIDDNSSIAAESSRNKQNSDQESPRNKQNSDQECPKTDKAPSVSEPTNSIDFTLKCS